MVKNDFAQIINKILKDNNLSADERYLLIILRTVGNKGDNAVCISYSEIMENFGCNRKEKISKLIKALKEKEYLEVKGGGRYKNIYKFTKDYLVNSSNGGTDKEKINSSTDGTIKESNSSNAGTVKKINSSSEGTIKSSNGSDDGTIGESSNNNKINNKINNKLYNNILNHWNSKNIRNENYLNIKTIDSINMASINFTLQQIVQAIDNYSEVYHSDYYYNYQWSLGSFLVKPNGLSSFFNDGVRWIEYKGYKEKSMNIYEECGINYEDYIN